MKKVLTVSELRELFLSYFESKDHLRLPSFSLIPHNDNSLLLINSGMAPLKPYFTGQEIPPRKRVATCQKCIRTGDIENIGLTARHGTFFEMLGNFSFGDYFKKDAILFSWEFLTDLLKLDKDRLYPSIYYDDNEAFELWHDMIGIEEKRIFKFGKEDNFWEHGSGPCGPCSEIYYDRGEKYGCGKKGCTVGCDCDRYMEIWNNVFTQFDNDGNGNYTELKQKNIDTGMGLERLATVCQDVDSIFEVDTNRDLMNAISVVSKHIYKENEQDDVSLRIIADHIKSCTFMISDGILPSNEGRGYVLRRLLRRAVRHGRKLGINNLFMADLSKVVVDLNKSHYIELETKKDMIEKVLINEEEKFNRTIDQGLQILNNYCDDLKGSKVLDGDKAFKLYDTFGFPLDLTKEIANEKNIKIDEEKFSELMDLQKETARKARKVTNYMGEDVTIFNDLPNDMISIFDGYDKNDVKGKILSIAITSKDGESINPKFVLDDDALNEGDEGIIILDKTSLYATMGGQIGDTGKIKNDNGEFVVYDTIKILNTKIGHIGKVVKGFFKKNDICISTYDVDRRNKIACNHTATHLLHSALREVLGHHVEQAGSSVEDKKLRFDFTHFKAMNNDEIKKVENIVNNKINENIQVIKKEMGLEEAKKEGAMALFGEKYGSVVRTVKVHDFSFELCGGTHVDNTSTIKFFKILFETAVSSGVRRIEAVTNDEVINFLTLENEKLHLIEKLVKSSTNDVVEKINSLISQNKEYKNDILNLKKEYLLKANDDVEVINNNDINVIIHNFEDKDMNELKNISDDLKSKYNNAFIFITGVKGDNVSLVVSLADEVAKKGFHAGNIVKDLAWIIGGRGGGKEKFAQAGGNDKSKINELFDKIKEKIIK